MRKEFQWKHGYFRIKDEQIVTYLNKPLDPKVLEVANYFKRIVENIGFQSIQWSYQDFAVYIRKVSSAQKIYLITMTKYTD